MQLYITLLAAALFPTQVRLPFPGLSQVAIVEGNVAAAADDGRGVLFLGDGKGHFRAGPSFAPGRHASGIAVADLNGDGKLDLIVANHEEKHVTVLLGPSFAPPQEIAVDVTPHVHSVAAADLDGDGKIDLVLNDMAGKRVVVLWGNGDGTFGAPTAAPTGSKGYAYNNVAVAGDRLFVSTHPQSQLAVLRARGRNISQEALLELPNPSFFALAIGADVAVATYSGSVAEPSRDGLLLLRGGRGPPLSYAAGHAPIRLATGDVNGDGIPDLAVCNLGGSVAVLVGGPDGLRQGVTLPAAHPQGIALGDLDGDGKADLAIAAEEAVLVFLTGEHR